MRTFTCLIIGYLMMGLTVFGSPAFAEEAPAAQLPNVTLKELVDLALKQNPEVISAKAESLAAGKRVWIESSLPDPMAMIAPGNEESEYEFSQEIPFPAKIYQKTKIAQNDAQIASLKERIAERDLLLRLTDAYYDLYYADASLDTIREVKELLKKFESISSTRYSSGAGTQRDVAKAQVEVSMAIERQFDLEQKRENVAATINALLSRDPMLSIGKAELPEKPVLEYSLIELVNIEVENRQEIKAAEEVVKKAAHTKRLANLAYIPDLDVGFKLTTPKEADNYWMVPIRFNVPVWQNRIIPEIHEAKQLEEARKNDLLQVKNATFQEVKNSFHRFQAASKMAELYETAVIPQAKLAFSADQAGYEAGNVDFLNLLDSERMYFNAKLSYIQFYTESLKSYVDLLRCCGLSVLSPKKEGVKTNEQK